MRFRLEPRVPAPRRAVEAALLDPAFLAHLADLPGLGGPSLVSRNEAGDVVRLEVRYRFTGSLSPAVTAVVDPDRLSWVEATTFDRAAHRGEHSIVLDHYADRLRGSYTTRLDEMPGDTTVRSVEGELRVRFPLVAGRVERAIVGGLTEHAGRESEALAAWLAEQG